MNCKPGDLARIVCTTGTGRGGSTFHKSKDRFITVSAIVEHTTIGPCWSYEEAMLVSDCGARKATAWPDAWLRPIRDNPGNESFVTESRKSLRIARENAALGRAPLEHTKPKGVEA